MLLNTGDEATVMKKQLVIVGIILLLICTGLSGCIFSNNGLTSLADLRANPENYLNKEIKIKGTVSSLYVIMDDQGNMFSIKTSSILSGDYYLTGIVRIDEEYIGSPLDFYLYYLDVTKIEEIPEQNN